MSATSGEGRRHKLKFTGPKGETRYGIFREAEKGERRPRKGFVFVDDAILPKCFEVSETLIVDLPPDFGGEYDKYVEAEWKKAEAHSKRLPKGLRPGKLFAVGVADGYAYYVVTRVTKRTVTVEWRGFHLDRWTDQVLGWGGSFPLSAIEPLVCRADHPLFGG